MHEASFFLRLSGLGNRETDADPPGNREVRMPGNGIFNNDDFSINCINCEPAGNTVINMTLSAFL